MRRWSTVVVLLCAVLSILGAVPAAAQTSDDSASKLIEELRKLSITGYLQTEYLNREDGIDEFRIRRARVKFTYQANQYAKVVMEPDLTSEVSVKDAYLELTEDWTGWQNTLTAGQFHWPFGFENAYSASKREVPEQSRVVRELFPGERDRGVKVSGQVPGGHYDYRIGMFNGNGTADAREVDSDKDVVGRFGLDFGSVRGGISGYSGRSQGLDKTRAGVDVQWDTPVDGLELRGEWIAGDEKGAEVSGWYGYAVYQFNDRQTFAVRLDEYDDEVEAVTTVVGAYSYGLNSNTKFMAAWEHPDEGSDVGTLRLQYKF